jgi:hypothetical protein
MKVLVVYGGVNKGLKKEFNGIKDSKLIAVNDLTNEI